MQQRSSERGTEGRVGEDAHENGAGELHAPREEELPVGLPGSPPVPGWAVHRRMYEWVLKFAHHRHATSALFLLSAAESSFFPIPPDVLQIALTLERRALAWWYAAVSTVGSVIGGVVGYLIGMLAWAAVSDFFFTYLRFKPEVFERVQGLYQEYDFWIIFVAAFTPIPYKVFTVAGGVFGIALPGFVVASAVGRGARFFLVAALLYAFGAPMKRFIEKYFNLLSLVFAGLLIGAFLLLKLV